MQHFAIAEWSIAIRMLILLVYKIHKLQFSQAVLK